MRFTPTILVTFSFFTAVASAEVLDSGQSVVSPGALDIPVQEGTFIPDNCPAGPPGSLAPVPICIAFPLGEWTRAEDAYVTALQEAGWRSTGGETNWYYFERPVDRPDCSQQMLMAHWFLGDQAEIAKAGTDDEPTMDWSRVEYGTFIFAVMPEICGDDRRLR